MQNIINKNKPDIFSQLIRQKIEDHTLPVDEKAWDAIQAGLKQKKHKRIIPLWGWYSGGIAAGILVLIFVLSPFNKQLNEKQLAENKFTNTKVVKQDQTDITHKAEPTETIKETKIKTQNIRFANKQSTKNIIRTTIAELESKTNVNDSSQFLKADNTLINSNLAKLENAKDEKIEERFDVNNLTYIDSLPEWNDPLKLTEEQGWGLIASVGSSNGSSTNQLTNTINPVAQTNGIVRAPTVNTSILTPADFSDPSYNAPLSAGLKVNKKLSKVISVETGFVYTYLQSNFKNRYTSATLNLHYVGIPVAVQANIWNSSKFGIYASTGAMIEKGIHSFYEQIERTGNQIITTTADTKIDGLQWSLNSSLGAKYSIFRDVDLYFEPRYSYYFDNNQPISIRTAKRHVISIEAGIKLKL